MWRSYVGGLCMGAALGGAACWLAALSVAPESARGDLLAVPLFPWAVLLAFALAGETLRAKAKRTARTGTAPDPA